MRVRGYGINIMVINKEGTSIISQRSFNTARNSGKAGFDQFLKYHTTDDKKGNSILLAVYRNAGYYF